MFKTNLKNKEKGQGLIEYSLILVLVAVVVVAVLMLFGPLIGNIFSTINSSIPGVGGEGLFVAGEEESDCGAMQAAFEGKWHATVGVTQSAMATAGWPSSGPVYDQWRAASDEFMNSSERSAYLNSGCQ